MFSSSSTPTISAHELARILEQETHRYIILDVRTRWEWKKSHIPTAVHIKNQIPRLTKGQHVVCVCLSAHRSKYWVQKLLKTGIKAVELEGGMLAWWSQKLPTEQKL